MTHTRKFKARNYAEASTNKIHSDEIARQHGFSGGLVPGVADYAYLAELVTDVLGTDWLEHGMLSSKLVRPVYDGDEVTAVAVETSTGVDLELKDSAGIVCAIGSASVRHNSDWIVYDRVPPPIQGNKVAPRASSLPQGTLIGSLDFVFETASAEKFARDAGTRGIAGFLLSQANEIVILNVDLGPWIHAWSTVWNFAIPDDGEPVSVRGSVIESGEKRGNEMVTLDLAYCGHSEHPIARVHHSAIIRLRTPAQE